MRTKKLVSLILAATLMLGILPATAFADGEIPNTPAMTEQQLEAELERILTDKEHPLSSLAVAIVKDGKVIFSTAKGYSYIDNENPANNKKANTDTKYRIASISKLVMTIGFMQLVEEGKIDLDADISEYLGFTLRNPNYPFIPITSKMLLSHTSSIRDGADGGTYNLPYGENIKSFFLRTDDYYENGGHFAKDENGATRQPGFYYEYCNLNFGVAAAIMEKVSGERFDLYMQNHVFKPMGLTCEYYVPNLKNEAKENLSVLYRKLKNGVWDANSAWVAQVDDYTKSGYTPANYFKVADETADGGYKFVPMSEYVLGTNPTLFSSHGGLRASVLDLAAILQMFASGGRYGGRQILKSETVDLMFEPVWHYIPALENGNTMTDGIVPLDLNRSYGLSTHIFTSKASDRLLKDKDVVMTGHLGSAYGLYSTMLLDKENKNGFICFIGGIGSDPGEYTGDYSGFLKWEEEIITAIFEYANFDE